VESMPGSLSSVRAGTAQRSNRLPFPRTLFTGPLEHRHLRHLLPLADVTVVPSISPRRSEWSAAEAAAAGSPPLVARHSGLAEVAADWKRVSRALSHLASFETGDAADLARKLNELLALSPAEHDVLRQVRPAGGRRPLAWASIARRCSPRVGGTGGYASRRMGDEQRVSWQELLAQSRDDSRPADRLEPTRSCDH